MSLGRNPDDTKKDTQQELKIKNYLAEKLMQQIHSRNLYYSKCVMGKAADRKLTTLPSGSIQDLHYIRGLYNHTRNNRENRSNNNLNEKRWQKMEQIEFTRPRVRFISARRRMLMGIDIAAGQWKSSLEKAEEDLRYLIKGNRTWYEQTDVLRSFEYRLRDATLTEFRQYNGGYPEETETRPTLRQTTLVFR